MSQKLTFLRPSQHGVINKMKVILIHILIHNLPKHILQLKIKILMVTRTIYWHILKSRNNCQCKKIDRARGILYYSQYDALLH